MKAPPTDLLGNLRHHGETRTRESLEAAFEEWDQRFFAKVGALHERMSAMNASKRIGLRPASEPRRLNMPDGFKAASVAVGIDGYAIRLLVREEDAPALVATTEQPGWASFPKTHTDGPYPSIVSISGASETREIRLSGLAATFVKLELLPEGEALIVASRCYRNRDGHYELNARVYGQDGKEKRAFLLGDGINHVQRDAQGNIWVAYFDEGVYGNFGWQHDGGPPGAAGLSCFTQNGRKIWDFHPPEGFDHISDCYALNVSGSGTWAYYYTDFPIAFIDPDWHIRAWKTQTSGARTFAVGSGNVLLYGGYGDRHTSCSLLRLGHDVAESIAEVDLILPDKVDLTEATVIGRGKELHVFSNNDWYVFSTDSAG